MVIAIGVGGWKLANAKNERMRVSAKELKLK